MYITIPVPDSHAGVISESEDDMAPLDGHNHAGRYWDRITLPVSIDCGIDWCHCPLWCHDDLYRGSYVIPYNGMCTMLP